MKESLRIVTTDGKVLSASRFIPQTPNGKVVLINSATGVRQRYYADFASHLADQGFFVYTYDYRGIGESKPKSLQGFNATMKDWGASDYHTMLQNVFQTHRDAKVVVIGHSVGGQIVGLSPLTTKVDSIVMIGAQTPFIKNFTGIFQKLKLYWFWYFLIPVFTKVFGYFPSGKLGLFEDLPAGVASQWARWAKSPDYLFSEFPEERKNFNDIQQLALMVNFTDDKLAQPLAVKDLMQFYAKAKWTQWQLKPEDVMQNKIGHFGFFKKRMESTLWKEVLDWMHKPLAWKENRAA
jgi:predicted alpha/beta hydrolase